MGIISMMLSVMAMASILFGWFAPEGLSVRRLVSQGWTAIFTRYGWPERPVLAGILVRVGLGAMMLQAILHRSVFSGIVILALWLVLPSLATEMMADNAQTALHEEVKRCQTDAFLFAFLLLGVSDLILFEWLDFAGKVLIVAAMSLPSTKHDGSRRFIRQYSTI
jgi:hypothetical protein